MQPLFEHRRRFGGFETRVLELEGEGPPLVLLHGYADSADTWRHVLDLLGRRDRRAVAVDLPGFATADRLRDGKVLPQLDRFVSAVVTATAGDGRAVLAGNSLGGCLALRAAQRARLPLDGVVPIAPAGFDMARWFVLLERDPILRTLLGIPAPMPEAVFREIVGRAYRTLGFHRGAAVDGSVVRAFTSHHRDRATVRRYLETGHRLLPELNDVACFDLRRITCPVALVWGRRDRMVAPTGVQRVLEQLPGTHVELMDDVGHCPQIEAAQRTTDLLCDFPRKFARAA
ncbi:MAG TPA: alpha/beta fold hydrolase [Solirubrobacteraceae bacterium]|nr:alpha/beta fold hydrolase [Solirubrobacteraceae bacterium]